MDLHRPGLGEWVAGASGAALVVVLFLPWYGRSVECVAGPCPPLETTAWGALTVIDFLLLGLGLMGLATWATSAVYANAPVPRATSALTAIAGFVGLTLVLIRLVFLPDADTRMAGSWLGLIAVAGVLAGAWTAMREEGFGLRPGLDISETHPERAPSVEVRPLPERPSRPQAESAR